MQAPLQARNDSDAAQKDTARTIEHERRFADNRPEVVSQFKLGAMMNNSPRMVAQRHQMNALFGATVKPQGDGAMSAEASPAQRQDKTNKTGLPKQLKSTIESLSRVQQMANHSFRVAQLQKPAGGIAAGRALAAGESDGRGTAEPVVQRVLSVEGVDQTAEMVADDENAAALQELIAHGQQWDFVALQDAVQTALMLQAITGAETAGTYDRKDAAQLGLHASFLSALERFPDVDGDANANGKRTPEFNAANPGVVEFEDFVQEEDVTEQRENEALIAAIKIRHMQGEGGANPVMANENISIEGRNSLDYLVGQGNRRYGLDPFARKDDGVEGVRAPQTYAAWLGDSYEKHVRTKKQSVEGNHEGQGHYSGLLDVSGIGPENLRELVNEMTAYEMNKLAQLGPVGYKPANLSLINAHLIEHNVAKYEYPDLFDTEDNFGLGDAMAMFGE